MGQDRNGVASLIKFSMERKGVGWIGPESMRVEPTGIEQIGCDGNGGGWKGPDWTGKERVGEE